MTMGGDDRLSELSDDLLRRILYFVPSEEAARTSKLSRRWRSLWRSSGAVNLTVQVHDSRHDYGGCGSYSYEDAEDAFYKRQEAFVHAAKAALDAAEAPITRLTLRVECNDRDGGSTISNFLRRGRDWKETDVVGDLVSHQTARHVEELCVVVDASFYGLLNRCIGIYGLASLPSSDTLHVLDLTRCNMTAAFPLPRLVTLRLKYCEVEPKVLGALLDAAPELTTVQLESLIFRLPPNPQPDGLVVIRLSFQAVTTLVLSSCDVQVQGSSDRRGQSNWDMEIDAPRLQSFKYKGPVRRFVLRPAAVGVARVDLHFLQVHNYREAICALFWQFMHNFTNARTIKLKVDTNDLKDIAVIGEASDRLLLCTFPNVERLELEGSFSIVECQRLELERQFPSVEGLELQGMNCPERETATVAIANLLECCPVLGEFMLKLSAVSAPPAKDSQYWQEFLRRKDRSDYRKSINCFMRHRTSKTAIFMEDSPFVDKYSYVDVPDIPIPGLSGRSFVCLQSTLKRVGLQFQLDNNSIFRCLGLRLIKFFADHASVLEELCVDNGNWRLDEHINFNVETQMTLTPIPISAIQHMSVAESSSEFSKISSASLDSTIDLAKSTAGFTVLPLQRQERMD